MKPRAKTRADQNETTTPSAAERNGLLATTDSVQHPSADLTDTSRLLDLHAQASHAGLIGDSEAEKLTFIGLAQHVLTYRPDNAGGLFHQLLVRRRFHFVTQEDEDAAQRRLKHYRYGGGPAPPQRATG